MYLFIFDKSFDQMIYIYFYFLTGMSIFYLIVDNYDKNTRFSLKQSIVAHKLYTNIQIKHKNLNSRLIFIKMIED